MSGRQDSSLSRTHAHTVGDVERRIRNAGYLESKGVHLHNRAASLADWRKFLDEVSRWKRPHFTPSLLDEVAVLLHEKGLRAKKGYEERMATEYAKPENVALRRRLYGEVSNPLPTSKRFR